MAVPRTLPKQSSGVAHFGLNHHERSGALISWLTTCFFFHRVLVVLDRLMSASLGRPCAIQEEEFVFTGSGHLSLVD
jgi:hypothetical protein